MPRAYADIVGNFRRGQAGAYARQGDYDRAASAVADDPQLAMSYGAMADRQRARARADDAEAFERSYADAYSRGDYEGMETIAGKHGNIQGVQGARQERRAAATQANQDRIRRAIGYVSALEQIESMPEAERQGAYEAWLAQARGEAQGEGVAFLERLPQQYSPRVVGGLRNQIEYAMVQELGPEEWLRYQREQRGEWQGGSGVTNAYRINPDGSTDIGGRIPVRPRSGGDDGPPAPPAGYQIVR